MLLSERLQQRIDWIEENGRGGHSYHSYYGNDGVVYANIKNYNFVDRDEVKKEIPKAYWPYFDKLSDEEISEIEWQYRNDEVENLSELACFEPEEIGDAACVGVYGRSGGWLGLQNTAWPLGTLEEMLAEIDEPTAERGYRVEDIRAALRSWNTLEALYNTITRFAKSFDAKYELVYQCSEGYLAEDWQEKLDAKQDIKKAKELAAKHGYILAREV